MNLPNFEFEKQGWDRDMLVAGVDEVGRGSFAGPLFAGCFIFPINFVFNSGKLSRNNIVVNDSKKLTHLQRLRAFSWLRDNGLMYATGQASVDEINKYGIMKATHLAFERSVNLASEKLERSIDYLLTDAFDLPNVSRLGIKKQKAVKSGDSVSLSIAAASIVAKVSRDMHMINLSRCKAYTKFGWDSNKGYGTAKHRKAILEHGSCVHHRKDFIRNIS